MSAQKVATAVGLAALVALLVGVGLPAILPPEPVPAIQIVDTEEPVVTPRTSPPTRDDDDLDNDDEPDDSPDDSPDDDDEDDDD